MKTQLIIILFGFFSNQIFSQSSYSLGIQGGLGMNVYDNHLETDKTHFEFNPPCWRERPARVRNSK